MEDDRRLVALEHLTHLRAVADVREDRDRGREAALVEELALDLEQRRLAVLNQDEPGGTRTRDLTAELGADRAAGAGHEDGLPAEVGRNLLEVDLDLRATEHVLHLHRPDLRGEIRVAGDQLVQAWKGLDGDTLVARDLDDAPAHVAVRRRDRDQQLVRPVVAEDVGQLGRRPQYAHPVDTEIPLARVVVDDADRRVAERTVPLQLADDELAGVPGADDHDLLAARDQPSDGGSLEDRPRGQPRPGDERDRQQEVEHEDRARQPDSLHRRREVHRQPGDDGRERYAQNDPPHVASRHVSPPAVVEAEDDEDAELDPDDEEDRPVEQDFVVRRHSAVEPELEREPPGRGHERRVRGELPEAMPVDREGHTRLTRRRRLQLRARW